MKKIERVAVIGQGAIGAAYASLLYDFDPTCVRFVVDNERLSRYKDKPFVVNGTPYPFQYVSVDEQSTPADLVIIAVKYDGLAQAIEDIQNQVGQHTIILSLLNGISSEEMIADRYGAENVLYAMSVSIDATREDRSVQFSDVGRICFGDAKNQSLSENVLRVKDLFDRAKVPYEIPEDMLRTLWWKFMINVGINQTSAVLGAPYGVFQEVPEARSVMQQAMREVVQLSQVVGVGLTEVDVEAFMPVLMPLSPSGKTSMLQDIEAGRKTEVMYLGGKVCQLGKAHGMATPVNEMLVQMIRSLEKKNDLKIL